MRSTGRSHTIDEAGLLCRIIDPGRVVRGELGSGSFLSLARQLSLDIAHGEP